MWSACEVLRTMDDGEGKMTGEGEGIGEGGKQFGGSVGKGEGERKKGRLYRIAMEKKGVFGKGGVPIEYARLQTDTPGEKVWDHEWTR